MPPRGRRGDKRNGNGLVHEWLAPMPPQARVVCNPRGEQLVRACPVFHA
jgi:hypothetical protein